MKPTRVNYVSDGSQLIYAFPFDYLRKKFITVTVNDVALTYGVDYTVNNKEVILTTAVTNNSVIVIERITTTDSLVGWHDATVLTARDLTVAEVQTLHLSEELHTYVKYNSITIDDNGNFDAHSKRIVNVKYPQDSTDAVNVQYVLDEDKKVIAKTKTLADNAEASAKRAKQSEDNAKLSEDNVDSTLDICRDIQEDVHATSSDAKAYNDNTKKLCDAVTKGANELLEKINKGRYKKVFTVADWKPVGNYFKLTVAKSEHNIDSEAYISGVYKTTDTAYVKYLCDTSALVDETVVVEADEAFDGFMFICGSISTESTGLMWLPINITATNVDITTDTGNLTATIQRVKGGNA